MKLTCYPLTDAPPPLVPGRPERAWMDEFLRHPYRCLPLVIANTTGWELLVPSPIKVSWNGGVRQEDLRIESPTNLAPDAHARFATSQFGDGIVTFLTGYIFRTEPGWDLWVGGPPNQMKHGVQPLTGIVETSWLAYPFTMNWRLTAPGSVIFNAGEAFGMLMPVPHAAIDEIEPVIKQLADDPEFEALATHSLKSRDDFQMEHANDPTGVGAYQRHYFQGLHADGVPGPEDHINRRRLKPARPAGADD